MLKIIRIEEKNIDLLNEKVLKELKIDSFNEIFIEKYEIEAKLFSGKKIGYNIILKEEVIKEIKKFLDELGFLMKLQLHSEIKINDDLINIVIVSENNAVLIGKDGRTLSALQLIIKQMITNITSLNLKVSLDISNYKAKKAKILEYEINKIAKNILKDGIEIKLDPMNSYERRMVHNIISKYPELETKSVGESPERFVTIYKK